MKDPEIPRTIEVSPLTAEVLDQEVARTGLHSGAVVEFALGVLAHLQIQTAAGDVVIRAYDAEPEGLAFRSWVVPQAADEVVIRSAIRRFAIEPQVPSGDSRQPALRLIRETDDLE